MAVRINFFILFVFLFVKSVDANLKVVPTDSSTYTAESSFRYIDSAYTLLFTEMNQDATNPFFEYDFHPSTVPTYSDSVYFQRIQNLNVGSTFNYQYNEEVREYIYYFSKRMSSFITHALAVKDMYFPLFEQVLDKYNMPIELKYLAIVESALNPNAKSHAGAVGLWQFMPATGKSYGLNYSNLVDDRRDPYEATDAACRFMMSLYNMYGDWNLVLAAYNAGPGNVNKAIKRAGGVYDYWKIRPFLPKETGGYVPAFIAVNYLMVYHEAHNLSANPKPDYNYYLYDTVYVNSRVTLSTVADWLNISKEEIYRLNPQYLKGIVPASADVRCKITLPATSIRDFILNKENILANITRQEAELRAEAESRENLQ